MKKSVIILFALFLLFTACTQQVATTPLNQLPNDYSLEDAKSNNCVVYEDLDITYGQATWDKFVQETDKGNAKAVRLAFYYTLGDPSHYDAAYYEEIKGDYPILYIEDLTFDGLKYTIEHYEDSKRISKEFKYMMKYEGRPRSTDATYSEYTYYVLVNKDTVTWDAIEQGMFSSRFGDAIYHYTVYSDLVLK